MKQFALLLCIILASCQKDNSFVKAGLQPSKVDSITTAVEAEAYIHTADTNYKPFRIASFQHRTTVDYQRNSDSVSRMLADKYKVTKGFYREDFDNNGYTDLIAIGGWGYEHGNPPIVKFADVLVVMNFGKDSVQISSLGNTLHYSLVPQVIHKDGRPMIAIHTEEPDPTDLKLPVRRDTITRVLTYNFGNLIEYNALPAKHKIEKIQFAAEPCFGKCPIFEIVVNQDRSAWFIAQAFNFSREWDEKGEGSYKTTLKQEDYDRLISLVNYLDFTKMNDEYFLTATDLPGATLIITYDGGKKKEIHDYGKQGTYGLKALYRLMEELRFNQNWKKAQEPKGMRLNPF